MSRRVLEILIIGLAKTGGLFIAFYSIIFISVFGSIAETGKFSAITAVLAPVVMFVTFRYVELINASDDKVGTLSEIVWSSAGMYGIIAVVVAVLFFHYGPSEISFYAFLYIALYKLFELFGDILVTALIAAGRRRLVAWIVLIKIIAIFFISGGLYWFGGFIALDAMCIALFVGFTACFLAIDLPVCLRCNMVSRITVLQISEFIKKNIGLGFFNLMISLNSVLPRYYILHFSDFRQLGIFTLTYQVSSAVVNVLQYPISINVREIAKEFNSQPEIGLKLLLGHFAALVLLTAAGLFVDSLPALFAVMASFAMFLGLLIRGVLITASLGLGINANYARSVAFSALFGISFLLVFELMNFSQSRAWLSFFYVAITSLVASWFLIRRINKNARIN